MKLKNFSGRDVNGFLDFDIDFNRNLSFITGINGSGKTTALNLITSLLLPKLEFLASTEFTKVSVCVENEGNEITLSAKKIGTLLTGKGVELSCSYCENEEVIERTFNFVQYANDLSVPDRTPNRSQREYYSSLLAQNFDNEVIRLIGELPTPMYLGLDRRSNSTSELGNGGQSRGLLGNLSPIAPPKKLKKNIFGASLEQSLEEAIRYAETEYRELEFKKLRLSGEFRRDIILALFEFEPISFSSKVKEPSAAELKSFEEAKRNLERLPEMLNISEEEISGKLSPLFNLLDQQAKLLGSSKNKGDEVSIEVSDPVFEAAVDWMFNKTHLSKINRISNMISKNNKSNSLYEKEIDTFLKSVNFFFSDSKKFIEFGEHGDLSYFLDDKGRARDLRTLSSGEIQLFVILTHLHFNPGAVDAGVFIVDEPELSLHVQWQEKFVNAVMEVNKNIQFVMATHSPSIIQEKIDSCIDISR